MRKVAERMGRRSVHPTPVGVFLATRVRLKPYFDGPASSAAVACTEEAHDRLPPQRENTLMRTTYTSPKSWRQCCARRVTTVKPNGSGYVVTAKRGTAFEADQVVFAAGALGTQRLLHKMKASGDLPRLSAGSACSPAPIPSPCSARRSPAGGAPPVSRVHRGRGDHQLFHPDERTHIEPCRYARAPTRWVCSSSTPDGARALRAVAESHVQLAFCLHSAMSVRR